MATRTRVTATRQAPARENPNTGLRALTRARVPRRADMTRGISLGQLVFAFFSMIFYHGYFKKELPYVSVDVLLDYNDLVRCFGRGRPRLARGVRVRVR